jgi:hypothetical protein
MTPLVGLMALTVSNPTLAIIVAAFISACIPAAAVVWRNRKDSPESMAVVLASSTTYLIELHARLSALEGRVAVLERENQRYYRLHGPLPEEDMQD